VLIRSEKREVTGSTPVPTTPKRAEQDICNSERLIRRLVTARPGSVRSSALSPIAPTATFLVRAHSDSWSIRGSKFRAHDVPTRNRKSSTSGSIICECCIGRSQVILSNVQVSRCPGDVLGQPWTCPESAAPTGRSLSCSRSQRRPRGQRRRFDLPCLARAALLLRELDRRGAQSTGPR
jgi:hypothetical protein